MLRRFPTLREGGFTLVELMITVVIVAILMALAGPGFRELLERNRLQSSASNLYTSLMLARSEALKRNQPVIMCKRNVAGDACETSSSGEWQGGWLVYTNLDANAAIDPNEILAVREALNAGDTLWAVSDPNDASGGTKIDELEYGASGGASTEVFFVLCNTDDDTNTSRVVSVEVTGRPKMIEGSKYCDF